MDNNELRPIAGYDNYLVSSKGEVYSLLKNKPRERQRLDNKIQTPDGKWWVRLEGFDNKGYRRVELGSVCFFVHRLVASAFIPNDGDKEQVNHKDGIRDNNCVENLEWVTNQENVVHSFDVLKRKPSYGGSGRKGYKDPKTEQLYDMIQKLLETTTYTKEHIADICECSYHTVKRCHAIRKVQRPSEYDFRRTRTASLGVGDSVPEAQGAVNG